MFIISTFISTLGSTLFDIVFVIYARQMPNAKLAVSIASVVATVPFILDIVAGYLADETKNHYRGMTVVKFLQAALFFLLSVLILLRPSWGLFIGLLIINLVSDLMGAYGSFVSLAVIKDIVSADDLADARGFESGVGSTISLVGGLVGATLIAALNYNYSLFGILNAGSFLVAFLILWVMRQQFAGIKSSQVQRVEKTKTMVAAVKQFVTTSVHNFKLLKGFPRIIGYTIAFSAINLIGSGQSTLLSLSYIQHKGLLFINFGYTVALIDMVESVGMIIGSFMPMKRIAWLSIKANLIVMFVVCGLISTNLLILHNRYLLVGLMIVSGVLIGLLNPRIQADMIGILPEKSIGSIMSVFYTVIQATVPLGAIIFAFVANSVTLDVAWGGLLAVVVMGLLYVIRLRIHQVA